MNQNYKNNINLNFKIYSTVVNGTQIDIQPAVVVDASNKFQSFQNMFFLTSPSASNDQNDALTSSLINQNFNINNTWSILDQLVNQIDQELLYYFLSLLPEKTLYRSKNAHEYGS